MKSFLRWVLIVLGILLGLWLAAEVIVRLYLETPLKTGFYGSLERQNIAERQSQYGVQVVEGAGWVHLGWIADPENESYRVVKVGAGEPQTVGSASYGSFLLLDPDGKYQVWAVPVNTDPPRMIGEADIKSSAQRASAPPQVYTPRIAGAWQLLFKPTQSGSYINDHTVFQDSEGRWRLVGITSHGQGDFNAERYFAAGASADFPPQGGMQEQLPVADFGALAWAPHVIRQARTLHMFWSPHQLHHMISYDGVNWQEHQILMTTPENRFFRDPMVLQVAANQWLLYTTARGAYFSQIDVYQSFDLLEWQYIHTALRGTWGSERNSTFASMESPFVTSYKGRFYLSLTYNNDSFFWPGILMLFHIWLDPPSYNETLVFQSDNPYDFGEYRGRGSSPSLLTTVEAHAPEIIHVPDEDAWYITTAGWPWVATLTHGEVAIAPLEWVLAP